MNKWIGISLGGLIGISHIGMIGLLATRQRLPQLNLPVSEYTSYKAKVSMDGYEIDYKANDPKTVLIDREVKEKGGFLGPRSSYACCPGPLFAVLDKCVWSRRLGKKMHNIVYVCCCV